MILRRIKYNQLQHGKKKFVISSLNNSLPQLSRKIPTNLQGPYFGYKRTGALLQIPRLVVEQGGFRVRNGWLRV